MSTFVLVHGAWHGAWSWTFVVPLLEQAGHKVVVPDLPGLGDDETPVGSVSLSAYADAIAAVVRAQNEPVVLVGHSMGGFVITHVAEMLPEKTRALIYLCAFLPANGESMQDWAQRAAGGLAIEDLVVAEDGLSATLLEDAISRKLYQDVAADRAGWARSNLRPQALAPWMQPVSTTAERFGRVERHYVECVNDRAVPVETQRAMIAALPCLSVTSIESGHSPFLSVPEVLADALLQAGGQRGTAS
ncbi:alpha/beta fold hydrolase [Sphingobium xenophagum]|uniref:alpha/beta fold hydrolase n=1 Tax=Sphingobium xenophagum TaxID=121428 RepID=UPI000381545A|nr:alpha/beta fold hydrolase [Sphingobium xenophagum]